MGWSFGWNSKKELVDHLSDPAAYGGNVKLLAKSLKGNHLWIVWQKPSGERYIYLALLQGTPGGGGDGWGYKDMSESMGPYTYDVPLKFLDMVPVANTEWREKVLAHHARSGKLAKLKPGMRVRLIDKLSVAGTPITDGVIQSVKPFVIISEQWPRPIRLKRTYVAEVLSGGSSVGGGKRRHGGSKQHAETRAWIEYDAAAEWMAAKGSKGGYKDKLPPWLSPLARKLINADREAFEERVRGMAYARAMEGVGGGKRRHAGSGKPSVAKLTHELGSMLRR